MRGKLSSTFLLVKYEASIAFFKCFVNHGRNIEVKSSITFISTVGFIDFHASAIRGDFNSLQLQKFPLYFNSPRVTSYS